MERAGKESFGEDRDRHNEKYHRRERAHSYDLESVVDDVKTNLPQGETANAEDWLGHTVCGEMKRGEKKENCLIQTTSMKIWLAR